MSIPTTKPVTAGTGTRDLRLFKELKLIQIVCFATDWHNVIHEKRRTTLYVCNYLYALKLFAFDKHILCYIGVNKTYVFYPVGPGFKSWSVFCCFPRLLQIIAITIPSAWTPISYLLFSPTFDTVTFLLLPTWYTNFLFIHINYIKLNSSTCFERNPPIIRRSTT